MLLLAHEGDLRSFKFGDPDGIEIGISVEYFENCDLLKRLILPEGCGEISVNKKEFTELELCEDK